jgi:hypothetical protein
VHHTVNLHQLRTFHVFCLLFFLMAHVDIGIRASITGLRAFLVRLNRLADEVTESAPLMLITRRVSGNKRGVLVI